VLSRIEITPQIPNGLDAHAHAQAPNVTWTNIAVNTGVDSMAGGLQAVTNELARPGGNVDDIPSQFAVSLLSGAEGPVAPSPAHRAPTN
jgi:hypothetical protein